MYRETLDEYLASYDEYDAKIARFDARIEYKEFVSKSQIPVSNFLMGTNIKYVIANKVFKKSLIGKIRFNEELTNSEDRLFIYEVIKKNPRVVKYNSPKYIYYYNPNSASKSSFSSKHESVIKSAEIVYADILKTNPELTKEADSYMFENLIIYIRKLAISTNKNEYIDNYNNVRKRIIDLSNKIEISKKRKFEFLILKNFNSLYPFFVKKFTERKSKIDTNKVKDDVFLN